MYTLYHQIYNTGFPEVKCANTHTNNLALLDNRQHTHNNSLDMKQSGPIVSDENLSSQAQDGNRTAVHGSCLQLFLHSASEDRGGEKDPVVLAAV